MIDSKYENRIEIPTENRAIKEKDVIIPIFITPFGGEPYAIWGYENDEGDSYYRAEHKYRNVVKITTVEQNENLIFSATWILTDIQEIKDFAKKYNKKFLER